MNTLHFSTGQNSLDVLQETPGVIAVDEGLAGQERPDRSRQSLGNGRVKIEQMVT